MHRQTNRHGSNADTCWLTVEQTEDAYRAANKMKMAGKIEGKQVHQEILLDGEFNKLRTTGRRYESLGLRLGLGSYLGTASLITHLTQRLPSLTLLLCPAIVPQIQELVFLCPMNLIREVVEGEGSIWPVQALETFLWCHTTLSTLYKVAWTVVLATPGSLAEHGTHNFEWNPPLEYLFTILLILINNTCTCS